MSNSSPLSTGVVDVDALLAFHRATFGDARMEGQGDPPPAGPPADPPKDEPKQMTQAELNALAAREKQQGKAAAQREIADQLGVPVDEAKRIIEAARAREDAEKTEAQRAREAADAEKTSAAAEKSAAAAERHATRVERALLRTGLAVPDTDADDFISTAVGLVKADVGADDDAIKAAVDKLKSTVPALFGTTRTPAPGSDPGRPPAGDPPRPGTFGSKGLEEARRRGFVDENGNPVKQPA